MSDHNYSSEQALQLVMSKLQSRDGILATHIQKAIDTGKDISDIEPSTDKRRRDRSYRKTVPFTHEEALKIAVDALEAYFVEQALFLDSAADNFAQTIITDVAEARKTSTYSGAADADMVLSNSGMEKEIAIELQTQTELKRNGEELFPMEQMSKEHIQQRKDNISRLRQLMDFNQE